MRRLRAKFDLKCYALIAGDFILKFNVFGPVNLALFMILDKMSQNMIIFSCWSRFNTNLHVLWCNGPVGDRSLCLQADVDTSGWMADDDALSSG